MSTLKIKSKLIARLVYVYIQEYFKLNYHKTYYLINKLCIESSYIAFKKEILASYKKSLREIKEPKIGIISRALGLICILLSLSTGNVNSYSGQSLAQVPMTQNPVTVVSNTFPVSQQTTVNSSSGEAYATVAETIFAQNTLDQSLDLNTAGAVNPDSIARRIRQAGELAVTGNIVQATEIFRQALKECQGTHSDGHECSNWLRALQGLNMMLETPKKLIISNNSIGMKLVRIPAAEYMMGSPKQELDWLRLTFRRTWREGHKQWFQDETPLHPIRITKPFYMGAYEVTVKEFRDFVNDTKYKTDAEKGDGGMIFSNKENRWVPQKNMKWDSVPWKIADNQPVVFVSWNDAQAFCKWLSRKEKRNYRLPTEAEWEMSCRGGAIWSRYSWGKSFPVTGTQTLETGAQNYLKV